MVQRDEIFIGQRRVVKVSIGVDVVKWRPPLFPQDDNDIPETCQAMNVDDDQEDQFE